MKVQPYLNFDGRCDEAIAFYRKALGAEVTMIMRYKDAPEAGRIQSMSSGRSFQSKPGDALHLADRRLDDLGVGRTW